jgi:hypothetical protein
LLVKSHLGYDLALGVKPKLKELDYKVGFKENYNRNNNIYNTNTFNYNKNNNI